MAVIEGLLQALRDEGVSAAVVLLILLLLAALWWLERDRTRILTGWQKAREACDAERGEWQAERKELQQSDRDAWLTVERLKSAVEALRDWLREAGR